MIFAKRYDPELAAKTEKNIKEYKTCVDRATDAYVAGRLDSARLLLSQAIQIYPNETAQKQLQYIQDTRPNNDEIQLQSEMYINYGLDAIICNNLDKARQYLECVKQPNDEVRELLKDVIRQKGRNTKSYNNPLEANKLLDKVEYCLLVDDLDTAEALLIDSWDMYRSQRTLWLLRDFIRIRLAQNTANSKLIESDRLVISALDEYENSQFEKARELLIEALRCYPNILINKLLVEVRRTKIEKASVAPDQVTS